MKTADLIERINATAESPLTEVEEEERVQLLAACSRLQGVLENPGEKTFKYLLSPNSAIALRIAIDMGLFDAAKEIGGGTVGGQVGVNELASHTGADRLLVARIMRILAAMHIFKEIDEETFATTQVSGAYLTGSSLAESTIFLTSQFERINRLPGYFDARGYKSPRDALDGPFQYTMETPKQFFEWLTTEPRIQKAFNVMMKTMAASDGTKWYEYFPVEEKLGNDVDSPSDTLIIDIGGGIGHELKELKAKFPKLNGKFVLQDLPEVVESIDKTTLPPAFEAMAHDMFKAQPIHGARAYYMRAVLHDYAEKQALQILGNIRDAMGANSLLLINEGAISKTSAPEELSQIDLIMMTNFASLERTTGQWQALLDAAGFDLVKVWAPETYSATVLLEAVVKGTAN